ncbi:MAG: hypothetical protein ACRBF0_23130 [Calditrichia bacterium]
MKITAITLILYLLGSIVSMNVENNNVFFYDDFENGLSKWDLNEPQNIQIVQSGDPVHGKVLKLTPGGEFVRALIKDSDGMNRYSVEADVLFPKAEHNYFGLIYHYNQTGDRIDFGSVYIKGNGSYIRVNPRRDYNAHRTLYEEYKTPLVGADAIVIGKWSRFKAEVIDSMCHIYVGDMITPKVTFDAFEFKSGSLGFKPRVVGGAFWLDNVRVSSIAQFSYKGPMQPGGIDYEPEQLITDWQVVGPFCGTLSELEKEGFQPEKIYTEHGGAANRWHKFTTDKRGCVVSGKLTEFTGGRNVAYFHTVIHADSAEVVNLHTSSNEAQAYWLNGEFLGYGRAARYAWYDFWKNPDHKGYSRRIKLKPGDNSLLIRVRGGKYAGGGFFAHIGREKK